jgi:hypothetical protein
MNPLFIAGKLGGQKAWRLRIFQTVKHPGFLAFWPSSLRYYEL